MRKREREREGGERGRARESESDRHISGRSLTDKRETGFSEFVRSPKIAVSV